MYVERYSWLMIGVVSVVIVSMVIIMTIMVVMAVAVVIAMTIPVISVTFMFAHVRDLLCIKATWKRSGTGLIEIAVRRAQSPLR